MRLKVLPMLLVISLIISPTFFASGASVKTSKKGLTSSALNIVKKTPENIATVNISVKNSENIAQGLLSQVEVSQANVEAAFELLEEMGIEIQEAAINSYDLGIESEAATEELIEKGNYWSASVFALKAIKHFGHAFQLVQHLVPVEPKNYADNKCRGIGLSVSIERAYVFLNRVNRTVDHLEWEGYNVSSIKDDLEEAKIRLVQALKHLEEGSINETAREHGEAWGILGRTNGLLHNVTKVRKNVLAERFLKQVESRILYWNVTIDSLHEHFEEMRILAAKNALKNTVKKVPRISSKIEWGHTDEVLDEIAAIVNNLDEISNELDEVNSTILNDVNRIQAQISVLRATLLRPTRKDLNSTIITQEIEATETLLDHVIELLAEGDIKAATELLEEAEGHLEEALQNISSYSFTITNKAMIRIKSKIREKHEG